MCVSHCVCNAMHRCIASTGRYSEEQLKAGAVRLKTFINHKYSDPMPVDMKFEMGGACFSLPCSILEFTVANVIATR